MAKLPRSIQDVPVCSGGRCCPGASPSASYGGRSVFNSKPGAGPTVTSRGHFLALGLGPPVR